MTNNLSKQVLFLSWESPWPPYSGAALRNLGFLQEISKMFEVELMTLTREPLSIEQLQFLNNLAPIVTRIPLRDLRWADKAKTLPLMLFNSYPYHSAILQISMQHYSNIRHKIIHFPGVVLASSGHWGTLIKSGPRRNWILNQSDADVEFWRVYASQVSKPLFKIAAKVNYRLAKTFYPQVYENVGRIISVCKEDLQETLRLAPYAKIDVIENGVDCSYYFPNRVHHRKSRRILFTGTSAERNMAALRQFVKNIFPIILNDLPDVELLIGGDFDAKAQDEFAGNTQIRFTGRVDDIRPVFNKSDIFIAPFSDTYGSKLKIAEAMAMAMPIVSTPLGIRGFQLKDGESVLIANSPTQFARHVILSLRNPKRCIALGSKAREIALSTIDWKVLGKRLVKIIHTTYDAL